jgi:hypothetical protein
MEIGELRNILAPSAPTALTATPLPSASNPDLYFKESTDFAPGNYGGNILREKDKHRTERDRERRRNK